MNIHIKLAIFSGIMAVITGTAALIFTGPLALLQLFLFIVNLITTIANVAVYRIHQQYQKDRATLEAKIEDNRAAMIEALNRK